MMIGSSSNLAGGSSANFISPHDIVELGMKSTARPSESPQLDAATAAGIVPEAAIITQHAPVHQYPLQAQLPINSSQFLSQPTHFGNPHRNGYGSGGSGGLQNFHVSLNAPPSDMQEGQSEYPPMDDYEEHPNNTNQDVKKPAPLEFQQPGGRPAPVNTAFPSPLPESNTATPASNAPNAVTKIRIPLNSSESPRTFQRHLLQNTNTTNVENAFASGSGKFVLDQQYPSVNDLQNLPALPTAGSQPVLTRGVSTKAMGELESNDSIESLDQTSSTISSPIDPQVQRQMVELNAITGPHERKHYANNNNTTSPNNVNSNNRTGLNNRAKSIEDNSQLSHRPLRDLTIVPGPGSSPATASSSLRTMKVKNSPVSPGVTSTLIPGLDRLLSNPDPALLNLGVMRGERNTVNGMRTDSNSPNVSGQLPGQKKAADAAAQAAADAKLANNLSTFSTNLRWFKYLLLVGGLRQQTGNLYRWYIRITVFGCAIMCFANIFMKTLSFRNILFDVTLVIMHVWVAVSYETWRIFTSSHHWRLLVGIVSQSKTGNFFTHINQVGIFGIISTIGACTLVCLGWIGPILDATITQYHEDGHYSFMMVHGIFMLLIIIPWSAACICSSVLFHMVVLAHQSDIEHYFQTVKSLLINLYNGSTPQPNANNVNNSNIGAIGGMAANVGVSAPTSTEALEETFGWLVRLHSPVRTRLKLTCHYFSPLYTFAIITSILLVFAGVINLNEIIVYRGYSNGDPIVWHNTIQDCFFVGLGCVALYGSLFVTSSIKNYWARFIQRINELPQFLLTHPSAHAGLVSYFRTADVAYTVYDVPVTRELMFTILARAAQILFTTLIIINWRMLGDNPHPA